ncbi:putative necrosis-inducing factor-domain-containing protein [Xylariales sp. AK1849]|nr:putative necrosis-inducing factor-domain-containing protein [Xylariales sp. AK1849]
MPRRDFRGGLGPSELPIPTRPAGQFVCDGAARIVFLDLCPHCDSARHLIPPGISTVVTHKQKKCRSQQVLHLHELESGVRIYGYNADSAILRRDPLTREAAGWCSASTIENDGSDNSPLITDCQVIMDQVYSLATDDNPYFGRSECGADGAGLLTCYFPVVSYETCMFGASTLNTGADISVRIGWQDVGDLISTSISSFGNSPSAGKVGASGQMDCPEEISAVLTYATGWGLYHA